MERSTRQREAIRDALSEAGRPLTPQELLQTAQAQVPGLGMATVYRNLKAMVATGALATVQLPGQAPRYEMAGQGHHHHFQCTACERVFEVQGCPGNLNHLAPQGFEVIGHELTLFGHCGECRQAACQRRSSGQRTRAHVRSQGRGAL